MMFLNSCRWRGSLYVLLQICVSGMRMTLMSARILPGGRGARGIVKQVAAGLETRDILHKGLRVHGDHRNRRRRARRGARPR